MRQLFLSITIALGGMLLVNNNLSAQDQDQTSVRERIERRRNDQQKKQSIPPLTIRAENMNQSQTKDISNAPWMREIYRFLDLNKDKNASLYFPVTPVGDRMNLFTMIFKLLINNEITVYEFPIGNRIESFTEENKINVKDFLDKTSVMYTQGNGVFVVDDSDIPSNEVMGYYVKEAWYFDKSNSVVDVKTLAICPVIFSQDDFGAETTRYPLFWLPYEAIRPYASRMPIMVSNLNNASNQTVDDFFRKRSYEGEIYKTTNMKNLSLPEMFATDSLVKKEQKKIEGQLEQFKKNLWAESDSISTTTTVKATKDNPKKQVSSGAKSSSEEKVRTNEPKQSNSKSAPARSMRNRRK